MSPLPEFEVLAVIRSCMQTALKLSEAEAAAIGIGGAHTPIASSRALEAQTLPHARDIVARIVDCF